MLFGILPTDLLITTAGQGLYRAHWTEEILAEAKRNVLLKRPNLDAGDVNRRFEQMIKAMPEAMLDAPAPELVAAMTNDPQDRHVLAAAVSIRAEVIVTENVRHFKPEACQAHGVEALTLDQFVSDLISLDLLEVWQAIEAMARRRQRPPETPRDICEALEQYIPQSLAVLRQQGLY